jgi:hypothetical protein
MDRSLKEGKRFVLVVKLLSHKINCIEYIYFLVVMGFELGLLGMHIYHLSLSIALFCDDFFFEIGSLKLFGWAGFKPQFS